MKGGSFCSINPCLGISVYVWIVQKIAVLDEVAKNSTWVKVEVVIKKSAQVEVKSSLTIKLLK